MDRLAEMTHDTLYTLSVDDFLCLAYEQTFQRVPTPEEHASQNSRLYEGVPRETLLLELVQAAGQWGDLPEEARTRLLKADGRYQHDLRHRQRRVLGWLARQRERGARADRLGAYVAGESAQMRRRLVQADVASAQLAQALRAQIDRFEAAMSQNYHSLVELIGREASEALERAVDRMSTARQGDSLRAWALARLAEGPQNTSQVAQASRAEWAMLEEVSADVLAEGARADTLLIGQYADSVRAACDKRADVPQARIDTGSLDGWLSEHRVYDTVILSDPLCVRALLADSTQLAQTALRVKERLYLAAWATDLSAFFCFEGFWPEEEEAGVPFRWARTDMASAAAFYNMGGVPLTATMRWQTRTIHGSGVLYVLCGEHMQAYPLGAGLGECVFSLPLPPGRSELLFVYENDLPPLSPANGARALTFSVHRFACTVWRAPVPEVKAENPERLYSQTVRLSTARAALHEAGFFEVSATRLGHHGLLREALGVSHYRIGEGYVLEDGPATALQSGAVLIDAYRLRSEQKEG